MDIPEDHLTEEFDQKNTDFLTNDKSFDEEEETEVDKPLDLSDEGNDDPMEVNEFETETLSFMNPYGEEEYIR